MIEEIMKIDTLDDLERNIKELYTSLYKKYYIPGILDMGSYIDDGRDFYLKLVIAHQKLEIDKTWLIGNMTSGLIDIYNNENIYDYLIYNVITTRRVKENNLYQLNPLLVGDNISEDTYDNNEFVNEYYNSEYSAFLGERVLIRRNQRDIYIHKSTLEDFLNKKDGNTYPKYRLIAEIEFRSNIDSFDGINNGEYKTDESYFSYSKNKDDIFILGSINIGILDGLKDKNDSSDLDIMVVNLDDGKTRELNTRNYSDDMEAGFIVLRKDIELIKLISENYFVYDLVMYDRENIENEYLIDVLEDKIVFWEGEFNKLPLKFKEKLVRYNIVETEGNIISEAMYNWQLNVKWDYEEYLYPEQKLAYKIRNQYFNKAIDLEMNFISPQDINGFSSFIYKLEKITKIGLDRFNRKLDDVNLLYEIKNENQKLKLTKKELEDLYRKYCFNILMVFEDE